MDITVASWNIWVFGDKNWQGIANIIENQNIDIIGIQEAAVYYGNNEKINMISKIAEDVGYNYEFYETLDFRPEKSYKMGNAVLSKYPIEKGSEHNLNPDEVTYDGTYRTEPRNLVDVTINLDTTKICFLTTHLQYSKKFTTTNLRIKQIEEICNHISNIKHPVILTGDFNSTPDSQEIQQLEQILNRVQINKPTWTVKEFEHEEWKVNDLKYTLDHIFTSDEFSYEEENVIETTISDHLPVKTIVKT